MIGGKVTACFGGYNNVKAFYIMCVEGLLVICVAIPIPFTSSSVVILTLLWLVLFMGAAILPGLSGILLNTVDFELRTQAASISNIFYNLCGMLPAPFVFGIIAERVNRRAAMTQLMCMAPAAVVMLFIVFIPLRRHIIEMGHSEEEEAAAELHSEENHAPGGL